MKVNITSGNQHNPSHPAHILKGKHVLLVEDCVVQGHLYSHYLQNAGAGLTLERTGLAAINTIRNSPTLFDVVVIDFQLPEMSGISATRQIRQLGYDRPIIAITASDCEDLKSIWSKAGCDDFYKKPLIKQKLINCIYSHTVATHETTSVSAVVSS